MAEPRQTVAEELDAFLGDPDDPGGWFSYKRCVELDDREAFPADICRRLDDWGLPGHYVPAEHGGRLTDYATLLQVMRAVARRDLTVAIGHGKTYLGGICVWVAGTREQAAALGADIRAGVPVSLGLTERAHGSDLLAGEVRGTPSATGWLVDGEKWLINNATRGSLLSLLTRTDPAGGPRGFSVLLVDKRELDPAMYRHLPKVRTHGIRGADISGVAFEGAAVDRSALVGAQGAGLEIVLKALQLTRTMCAALSLGAADHALRIALGFALDRELYGRRLVELPQARRVLATAGADVLLHEALGTAASRLAHTQTDEMSVTAAVTKYLLPSGTEDVLSRLTRVLGARAFLKGVHAHGTFQKVERDHRIVGMFDGNTLVNLNSLINQFRSLVRGRRRGTGDAAGAAAAYDLSTPLPPLDPGRLSLVARRGSGVLAGLEPGVARLEELAGERPALAPAAAAARRVADAADRVHQEMEQWQGLVGDVPPAAFEVARRYALCHAAAVCLGLWTHSQAQFAGTTTEPLWRDGLWLRAALDRILDRLGEGGGAPDEVYDALLDHMITARSAGELFSLYPHRLPGTPAEPVADATTARN
ncbi:acyl-CoA dehydrogenase [Streptomyces sp. CB09001]|uniref:acyl-CoA dehydrogenase family protein n=1 Tax=Streptomyces sp. CB09001 TaxID=2083284 RepID=UPI000E212C01|nr:acyl-CoA dehydrogenase family protein [Streptomyces sp. CB09001]AXL92985.1 acyl-CoA dehydrogenase [Streptomyces sp. CB09001]